MPQLPFVYRAILLTAVTAILSLAQLSGQDTSAPVVPLATSPTIHKPIPLFTDSGITPPVALFTPEPKYSIEARKKKLSGTCLVKLTIDESGLPQDVRVVHSIADDVKPSRRHVAKTLDAKAIEAVQQYRFKPAMKDGRPVAVEIDIEVNFRII